MKTLNVAARHRTTGMIYRQVVLYGRHLDRKCDIFLWPVIDAVLFGAIGTYAARDGSNHTLVLMLTGFVMAQIVWHAHIHLSKFFMQETWDWNVLYLMTRPIRVRELWFSVLGVTGGVTLAAGAFISVAIAITFGLRLLSIPPAVALLIPILIILGWSTGLFATALVLRMGQKADNFAWAMFGLIGPLSGSIVPVSNLPVGLRDVALIMPTTHAYEAGRAIVFGTGTPWLELGIAAGGALALFCLSLLFLSRSMQKFRDRGYISRYM